MTAGIFNLIEAARDLEAAGIEAGHAEAIAEGCAGPSAPVIPPFEPGQTPRKREP